MNAKEVAKLTGISVRTLHHYDAINLLRPNRNKENGYREYSEEDMDKLQQILFFKECGFPLAKIQKLLNSSSFNREEAFQLQKKYLLHEKKRIETMLDTLNRSMKSMKGEITMSLTEKFGGFDMNNNPYEEEARRLWGDEAVDKSNAHISSLTMEEKDSIAKGMDHLFTELATIRNENPASDTAQKAMEKMYRHFNKNFGYQYTLEAFAGVGQMYITDIRFTENVDQYGKGLSQFLAEAMKIYADSQTE
jgi:DNA-binding transcriptional MerR regulator